MHWDSSFKHKLTSTKKTTNHTSNVLEPIDTSVSRQNILDISEMTEDEAERLIQRDEERCIVLYRREDGTDVTIDCPGASPRGDHRAGRTAANCKRWS